MANFLPGDVPKGAFRTPVDSNLPDATVTDPDLLRVLEPIYQRQAEEKQTIQALTPETLAWKMMHNVPYKDWHTPLVKLGHWPRGSSIAEIKKSPELMELTPAKVILKLFELGEAQKRAAQEQAAQQASGAPVY